MAHHAVLVHIGGWDHKTGLAEEISDFRDSLPPEWRPLVIGPIPTVVNGDFTAAFLPDGSKEFWSDSDDGDTYRGRFIDLFGKYDDLVVVRFGGDEPNLAAVTDPR